MSAAPHLPFEKDIRELEDEITKLRDLASRKGLDVSDELRILTAKLEVLKEETYQNLEPIEQVQVARHPQRPYTLDYVQTLFTDWVELKGDRLYREDGAIVGGWGRLADESVMIIGHQRGRDMKENLKRNFGMAHPEGYRKGMRLMKMADKFRRPIITFIDTTGAYPGVGAEERGQAEAIASSLRLMAGLKVPTMSVVIGEGGSGGALALGVTDRILMMENAIYSVITPEGCAAILWRSAEHRDKAAKALRVTSSNLLELGVADEVIPEPPGGAHNDWDVTMRAMGESLQRNLKELTAMDPEKRLTQRWAKYESMGSWNEA